MKKSLLVFVALSLQLLLACNENHKYDEMKYSALRFGTEYFNFRYQSAMDECTSESEKWIRFAASNISADDLKMINAREHEATCEATDAYMSNDTCGVVMLRVHNFLTFDSIGVQGKAVGAANFRLDMKKKGSKWKVAVYALPRQYKD